MAEATRDNDDKEQTPRRVMPPALSQAQMSMFMLKVAPSPSVIPRGTPVGLEFLLPTPKVLIHQQIEWGEVLTGVNTNNRYNILDAWGRRMYIAAEDSDFCSLVCWGNLRSWSINIYDCKGQSVMQGHREGGGVFKCCANTCQVLSPIGDPLGSILQLGGCERCAHSWNITDDSGVPVFLLKSPYCSIVSPMFISFRAEFPILNLPGGEQIGKITKKFAGYTQEMMTNADNFEVEFPADLDVKLKATLIYATFLIDFMYYENNPGRHDHHHHHHLH